MIQLIRKAAVIGSGVMGSGIAAHLANAGIPVLLLDRVLEGEKNRSSLSEKAIRELSGQKPAPLALKDYAALIKAGNLEDDADKLADADWIIEVVVERLDVKKDILALVDVHRKTGSIVSSNTSGISIEAMTEGRSEDFKKHFLGTHFFNPPRYLKLLELIPTPCTNPDVTDFMKSVGENILGKGVVIAKDTPNFIANRIGTYGLLKTMHVMEEMNLSFGEADSVTGPLIGRPKSATFRTLDVVGIDTFIHVAENVYEQADGEEKVVFTVPKLLVQMQKNGWIGAKAGQGFFKKEGQTILELNAQTMEYGPRKKLKADSVERAKQQKGSAKWKTLLYAKDEAGTFLWRVLAPTLLYSAALTGKIADDIVAIDRAMKWGFGWKEGPFEIWDQIGRNESIARMEAEGLKVPAWVKEMKDSFYKYDCYYDPLTKSYKPVPQDKKVIYLSKGTAVIKENSGARLHDIGDGAALLEFTSPNNAIGLDIIQMINLSIEEVEKNYQALVIGNQGKNFCVGANLALILMAAQDEDLWEIEATVKQFQQAMMNIKYSPKPVVAAPFGMTLGGGAEVCLPAAHIQAAHETYIGLVEAGVGLIPGGGGNKELYIRCLNQMPGEDLQAAANKAFETIALAHVSTSAAEARKRGFLYRSDGISLNGDHVLYEAKKAALHLADTGYRAPIRKKIPVTGETGYATMLMGARSMHTAGFISDHDFEIAQKLAWVIAGGRVPFGTEVEEEYLLELERAAFLQLAALPKTQQRMQHMLLKGKPLRN
ncbi:3-hydroxyacyl-CoA dehydrogenase NAD-binding domain-containing protein [Domibacillus sp. DTU_2020_1001157_1_SI_ALB_TIR_016]|uniref:3-hydroxyacyl-CoA dehydrogenase/enoyl-CoA hydratase family protein n=1 Tax=Domibacillus sp. DTU_2020_1001157_1_SI_ALB_TIR_016 TaxID=3077789 RepID=UPI0028F0301E|nr:3-hydroxyacyl-CoA dehydrogenase NAD-binding domain-containing protein [Domibacillus sp. DTU_2020_1001157_1_SI_ALB_TIR_016]WNS81583.1 3-hydroxyacyl-CoA dehydrogenase NAD-binding domain-containing protein [Domibacillus sp. DTU_2020_1001157_1_SI_ALB_TIR_016]